MKGELPKSFDLARQTASLPMLIARAGPEASKRFLEFFTANIRNKNTRAAYIQAVKQFIGWIEKRGCTDLKAVSPMLVAGYIESHRGAAPTVKQHLAAIRMLFDWLVVGQVVPTNPASSVRGPKHVVKRGKTTVLTPEQARKLIDSIDASSLVGLRDRALIALMIFSFARVSAVVKMKVSDYFQNGKRYWIRLLEKGSKVHEIPVHHTAELYLDQYIRSSGIEEAKESPLFRSAIGRTRNLAESGMSRFDAWRMIQRRTKAAGIKVQVGCHTFRATGITAYLSNGGTIENAQAIAAHESPRTTKLYDRRNDEITLDEIERIRI